jgi:hypothetical protein
LNVEGRSVPNDGIDDGLNEGCLVVEGMLVAKDDGYNDGCNEDENEGETIGIEDD